MAGKPFKTRDLARKHLQAHTSCGSQKASPMGDTRISNPAAEEGHVLIMRPDGLSLQCLQMEYRAWKVIDGLGSLLLQEADSTYCNSTACRCHAGAKAGLSTSQMWCAPSPVSPQCRLSSDRASPSKERAAAWRPCHSGSLNAGLKFTVCAHVPLSSFPAVQSALHTPSMTFCLMSSWHTELTINWLASAINLPWKCSMPARQHSCSSDD